MEQGVAYLNPFKRGQRIVIPKGIKYRYRGEARTAKRTYTVMLHSAFDGYYDRGRGDDVIAVSPAIVWAGAGGYWCDARVTEEMAAANGVTLERDTELDKLWEYELQRSRDK